MKLLFSTAVLAVSAFSANAATLSGSIGYGLGSDGTSLTIFNDLGDPSSTTSVTLSNRVNALAYRPVTGELYGYGVNGGGQDDVFVIDPTSGTATNVGANATPGSSLGPRSTRVGFDFNNQIDAARAVNIEDKNNVFFPAGFGGDNDNSIRQFMDLAYGDADPVTGTPRDVNFGKNPSVFANAYTNAVDGQTASSTQQFALDAVTDSLVTLANNAGTLRTVAPITAIGLDGGVAQPVDFNTIGGFEILSDSEGDNLAIALLRLVGNTAPNGRNNQSGLFTIDLTTGIATQFADLGNQRLTSFAAQTEVSPVPVPAAGLLLGGALGVFGFVSRRRRAKAA